MRQVSNKLPIDATNPNRADRTGKRNVGNAKRRRRAVERENVGIVFAVRAKEQADYLRVVKITLLKKWPERPINHSRSERFLFGGPSFALEITAGKFSRCGRFFAIID